MHMVMGHSIERLCAAAAQWRPEFEEKVKRWSILDGYYVPTRYPNSLPDSIPAKVYTKEAALEAVGLAQEMVEYVSSQLTEKK